LKPEIHSDKTAMGKDNRAIDSLGFHLSPERLLVVGKTAVNFITLARKPLPFKAGDEALPGVPMSFGTEGLFGVL